MDGFIQLGPDDLTSATGVAKLNNMLQALFNSAPGDGNTIQDLSGYGSPEGAVTAAIGSTYRQVDGTGPTAFWTKQTGAGNTGWVSQATITGIIAMWSGSIATIPSGWVLCNGSNGTPDLRNCFIVGANADVSGVAKSTVSGSATQTGGAATKDISHNHSMQSDGGAAGAVDSGNFSNRVKISGSNIYGITGGQNNVGVSITVTTGGSTTQDVLNPYYALAFIMHT